MFWLQRSQMFIKYVEQITFRSAGANNLIDCGVNKHSVPPGLAAYSLVTNA